MHLPRPRTVATVIAAALLHAPALLAQDREGARADARAAAADSMVQFALERARAGDTSAAIRALEKATKRYPKYAPAHYQRGVLLSRTTSLGLSDVLRRRAA